MTYREATEYIEECKKAGIVPGLDSIRELLRRLGNPEKELKFIHIAGTNGKGSVLNYLSGILTESGYRTGRYISPVISEYREQFQIDGKMMGKITLARLMEKVRAAAEAQAAEGFPHPTAFEVETALAFLWYEKEKCDVVVLETGMGGLLDATNVIPAPALTVLVSISMDHMGFLGNTLEKIAEQKAGIIKTGSRVVSVRQRPEAAAVIERTCEEKGCPLTIADPGQAGGVRYGLERQLFNYGGFRNLEIHMAGKYQIDNAVLAVEAVRQLKEAGFVIPEEPMRAGLLKAQWPGRFEVIGKKPLFVADGAHNEDGARRLAESAGFYFTNRKQIYIIGMLKDKEVDKMVRLTCGAAWAVITVTVPGNPRAMSAVELAERVRSCNSNVTAADSVEEAVEMARLLAGKDDVILAFGSLYYQGALRKAVERGTVRSDTHGK